MFLSSGKQHAHCTAWLCARFYACRINFDGSRRMRSADVIQFALPTAFASKLAPTGPCPALINRPTQHPA